MIRKAQSFPLCWRKEGAKFCNDEYSEVTLKMSLFLNFPPYQSLPACRSALIIPFCQRYFILSVAPQLHYIIINSESKKIREVTIYSQGYLCFLFRSFKSSWAVAVYKWNTEDLVSVS